MTEKEPSAVDLAAIEAEWPVIAAELELVGAECRLAHAPADPLAIRAHRRAIRAVLAWSSAPTTGRALHRLSFFPRLPTRLPQCPAPGRVPPDSEGKP